MRFIARRFAILFLSCCALAGASLAAEPLKLGIMPFNSALALVRTHAPLRDHLQARLGRPVDIFTSADYFTYINESLDGRFDLLIAGPHFAVMAAERGYVPLMRYAAVLQPVIVVRKDAGIHGLADLRGKRIGLSSRLSISSIGGVRWLQDAGLQFGRDYQLQEHATHGAAIAAVAVGELDAALTTYTPLRQAPQDVQAALAELPSDIKVPHLMTLAHQRLGRAEIDRLRAALAEFPATPAGRAFFEQTGYQGYENVGAADLKAMRPYVELTRRLMGLAQ